MTNPTPRKILAKDGKIDKIGIWKEGWAIIRLNNQYKISFRIILQIHPLKSNNNEYHKNLKKTFKFLVRVIATAVVVEVVVVAATVVAAAAAAVIVTGKIVFYQ